MTFRDYLFWVQVRDNPRGDFIKDARFDKHIPNAQSWPELEMYLELRHACESAKLAAHDFWREYARRHRRSA